MVILTLEFCELPAADWAAFETMEETSEAVEAAAFIEVTGAPVDVEVPLERAVALTGAVRMPVAAAEDVTLFEAADEADNVMEMLDVVVLTLPILLPMVLL